MVRTRALLALGLCLFTQSLIAKEKAGEWILTIDTPRNWVHVARSLRGQAKSFKVLGTSQRYALLSATNPSGLLFRRLKRWLKAIQPNYVYSTLETDPDWSKSWGLSNIQGMDIQAEPAWKISTGSKNVRVAILDSGFDKVHEDLQRNLSINPGEIPNNGIDDDHNGWIDDTWGWNFIKENNDPSDDNGHGSFCAGIIGADWDNGKGTRGINQDVSLIPVKTLDFLGQGSTATAIEGIEYALARGAHLVNLSWGGNHFDPALYDTIKNGIKKGVLFVAAAGNSGQNNEDPEQAIYPASFDLSGMISVAAYDLRGERAPFTNYGKNRVHLGAPGLEIFGVDLGGYRFRSGTSFAAPHVTGVAALLKAVFANLSPLDLKDRILKGGTPLHPYEKYYTSTGSFLNAENALLNKVPTKPPIALHWRKIPFQWSTEHPYLTNQKSVVRVNGPGASRLRIHFRGFRTEKTHDFLVIRDKENRTVFSYTGDLGDFTSVEVLADEAEIEFVSDYNRPDYGFDIDYFEATDE